MGQGLTRKKKKKRLGREEEDEDEDEDEDEEEEVWTKPTKKAKVRGKRRASKVGRHINVHRQSLYTGAQEQYFYIITSCMGLWGCSGLKSFTQDGDVRD